MTSARGQGAASNHAARLLLALVAALALGAPQAACRHADPRPHEPLGASAEPLRSAFNADAGKPRIVILAAPT
jgi:hypothetical protein